MSGVSKAFLECVWLLSKVIAIHDNEIVITYARSDIGVAYPSTISYAAGEREVALVYEVRSDKILDFPGVLSRTITERLPDVWVNSPGGASRSRLVGYSSDAHGSSTI